MLDAHPKSRVTPGGRVIAGLTPTGVIDAALALIDRVGLAAFSMRRLAGELGVQVGALYVHVSDKEAVLGAVADRVLEEIELPQDLPEWEDWVHAFAAAYRDVMQRHPHVAPLIARQLTAPAHVDPPPVAALLRALERAGFEGLALEDACNCLAAFLIGFVTLETERSASGTPTTADNGGAIVGTGRPGSEGVDEAFAAAVDIVVAGLRSVLQR